jgi:transcriptional regulator with XRE-family HTH domain
MQTPPLRTVREARGRSLRAVAQAAGVDPAHLSRIERGIQIPTLPVLYRLASTLGLSELENLLAPYIAGQREPGGDHLAHFEEVCADLVMLGVTVGQAS